MPPSTIACWTASAPPIRCALPLRAVAAGDRSCRRWAGSFGAGFERAFVIRHLLGVFSVYWGYRRHRAVRALSLLVPGLLTLWAVVLYQPMHAMVVPHAIAMTFGGTLVGLAHIANLRLNHGHVHDAGCAH
jgi:hypothetical protein